MLLPTEQAFGQAATGLLQSMLDQIEERRKEQEEKRVGKTANDPMVEARITASEEARRSRENIAEAFFNGGTKSITEQKIELMDQLGKKLGINRDDYRSSYGYGKAIEEAISALDPASAIDIKDELGLDDLGISLTELVAAIKNPYGDEDTKLENALNKLAGDGKHSNLEIAKIVQRLEDTADPKSLEELKVGPQGWDPTRVEDAETRAERRADIKLAEASEKLEDVQEMQEAVSEAREGGAAEKTKDGTSPDAGDDLMLQVLAASVEQAEDVQETDSPSSAPAEGETDADVPLETGETLGEAEEAAKAEAVGEAELEAQVADAVNDNAEGGILSIYLDEAGIYAFLKEKAAAAA